VAPLFALACAGLLAACGGSSNKANQPPRPPRPDFVTPRSRNNPPAPPGLGARLPVLSDTIIATAAAPAYNSDPPTSGPHLDTAPRRGIYANPLPSEALPAFLARGGVEVLYNASASPDVVRALTEIVNAEIDRDPGLVLLAPRPQMPCQVTVTAWAQIIAFGAAGCQPGSQGHTFNAGSVDDALIRQFIERSMCSYDPDNVCGQGPHGLPTPGG